MLCLHPHTRSPPSQSISSRNQNTYPKRQLSPASCRMALENDAVAGATIELLEARLQRLTYLLTGDASWTGTPTAPAKPASLDDTVSRRLLRLEKNLENLSRNIPAVRDVLQLRKYSFSVSWRQTKTNRTKFRRSLPRPLPPDTSAIRPREPNDPEPRLDCPLVRIRIPGDRVQTHFVE
jgi:hypothetical protein